MRLHLAIIITLYVIIMRFPVISQTDLFPEALKPTSTVKRAVYDALLD